MLINSPNISGSLRVTGNIVATGSLTVSGTITGTVAGTTATASYVEYTNVANKPTLVSGSGQISFNGITDKPTLVSGSSQVSFNGITDKPTLVSGSSQITYSGLSGIPSGIVSGSAQVTALGFASTGSSNTFQANQTITGSLFITQNLIVAGSSSIQYISSSVLDIADNTITVNTFNPGVRFGGLGVIDSGSSPQVSGSMLFDSIKDQWIFVHQNQSVVTSSIILMGPETYNDLGNESYISANRLPKGSGVEHLRDSNISDTGTVVSINSNTGVTGSLGITGSLTVAGAGTFSSSVTSTGGTEIPNGQFYRARRSSSNLLIDLLGIESGTDNTRLLITGDFNIKNGSLTTLLNMTTAGAATFSSSITASGRIHASKYGNSSGGSFLMGIENNSETKWSYLCSTQYNSSTNPSGFSVIGGFTSSTENKVIIGGSIYEANPCTSIEFWTHTAVTHAFGGTLRMRITTDAIKGALYFDAQTSSGFRIRNSNDTANAGGWTRRGLWEGNTNFDPALWAETGYGLYFYSNGSADIRALFDTSGHFVPGSNNTYNLGSSSNAWANIYTNDLHLSNMGKEGGNDIDGTSGTWTIQEGAEDLYIINNRNNKKFKIKLEEII